MAIRSKRTAKIHQVPNKNTPETLPIPPRIHSLHHGTLLLRLHFLRLSPISKPYHTSIPHPTSADTCISWLPASYAATALVLSITPSPVSSQGRHGGGRPASIWPSAAWRRTFGLDPVMGGAEEHVREVLGKPPYRVARPQHLLLFLILTVQEQRDPWRVRPGSRKRQRWLVCSSTPATTDVRARPRPAAIGWGGPLQSFCCSTPSETMAYGRIFLGRSQAMEFGRNFLGSSAAALRR